MRSMLFKRPSAGGTEWQLRPSGPRRSLQLPLLALEGGMRNDEHVHREYMYVHRTEDWLVSGSLGPYD